MIDNLNERCVVIRIFEKDGGRCREVDVGCSLGEVRGRRFVSVSFYAISTKAKLGKNPTASLRALACAELAFDNGDLSCTLFWLVVHSSKSF
jgi:hypothetical protein